MASQMLAVIVDCKDARKQAKFWADVLSYDVSKRNEGEFLVSPRQGEREPLYFMDVPEPKTVKNRLHIDLVADGSMEEEVARLEGLGARLVEVRRDEDTLDNPDTWSVMTDPEGNEFCVSSWATITGWS